MQKKLRKHIVLLFIIGIMLTGCAQQPSGPDPLINYMPTLEKRLSKLEQTQAPNLDNFLKTVTGEVPFASGDELSEEGLRILEEIAGKVVKTTEEFLQQPEQGVTVKITVLGYTDGSGYIRGGELETELLKDFKGEVSKGGDARRQLLNKLMSERRANIVYDYINQRLAAIEQVEAHEARIQIESQIEGLGEELPSEIPPPYPKKDPRRWICKVWVEFTSYAIED